MCSGFPNGTNVIPILFKVLPMVPMVIGNANGTIDSPNGTIGANGKPMVQWYRWENPEQRALLCVP